MVPGVPLAAISIMTSSFFSPYTFSLHLFLCAPVDVHMPQLECGEPRTACRSQFSPTPRILVIELMLSDWLDGSPLILKTGIK